MDYSKWDAMAAEEDRDEQRRKAEQRQKNKEDYHRQQEERIQQHQQTQKQQQQPPATADLAHSHHTHDHSHSHDQPAPADPSASEAALLPFRRTCGCGFTDVDTLLAMQKHAAAHPGPSAEEKRHKQFDAIAAIRTHAKELYAAQQYQSAYALYERGALILAGMTDLPAAAQQSANEHELCVTHNMALCQLQMRNYAHAVELCRTALQLTDDQEGPEAAKAHYRMAQCFVRLGRWEEAEAAVADVNKRGGWKGLDDELRLMRRLKEAERVKEREFSIRMKDRMQAEQEKERQRLRRDETRDDSHQPDAQ